MDDFLSQALSTNSTSPLIEDILPIEDVDTDSCQLLGPVALAVQVRLTSRFRVRRSNGIHSSRFRVVI